MDVLKTIKNKHAGFETCLGIVLVNSDVFFIVESQLDFIFSIVTSLNSSVRVMMFITRSSACRHGINGFFRF